MPVTGSNSQTVQNLSIRKTADGFSLYIYNQNDSAPLQVENVRPQGGQTAVEALRQALTRPRGMEFHFAEVRLLSDEPCTFLPLEEFRSSDIATYYFFNFPESRFKPSEVCYDILASLEVAVLYAMEASTVQTVVGLFPEAKVCSQTGLWLEQFAEAGHRSKETIPHFYVQIQEHQMLLALLQQGRLCFACNYAVSNDPDRLYYLLSVWKNMELDGEKHHCTMYGASDVLTANVRKYVRNVAFIA